MANKEHLAILKQGVEVWNKWRRENPNVRPSLEGANLSRTKLSGANLRFSILNIADLSDADLSETNLGNAKLREANLYRADLQLANLHGADLKFANLSDANLANASLRGCNLSNADLSLSNLQGVDLSLADLGNTNFTDATIGWTTFAEVNLSEAKSLESTYHIGPSSIGLDTIYRSKGKIPDVFLRCAGVPDNFIKYMHSLTGEALQFYSCFISYSSKDQEFAERLYADLRAKGVRCWFAPHDIQGGRKVHEQIDQAIRVYEKLLLILSEESMKSEWVKTEIANARQREINEKRQMLFPVSLVPFERIREWKAFDAGTGKDSAREIREYFIPDFSNWKDHDSYLDVFDQLLRDLKAEPAAAE
jgi:hypothetical protein